MKLFHVLSIILVNVLVTFSLVTVELGETVELYTFEYISGATFRPNSTSSGPKKDAWIRLTSVHDGILKVSKRDSQYDLVSGNEMTLKQLNSVDIPIAAVNSTGQANVFRKLERSLAVLSSPADVLPASIDVTGQLVLYSRRSKLKTAYRNLICYLSGLREAKIGGMKVSVKELAYAAYEKGQKVVASTVNFVADIKTIVTGSITISTKKKCGGGAYSYNQAGTAWTVLISTYTTDSNCDTTASTDDLRAAYTKFIEIAELEGMIGHCCKYNHGVTWHADMRVCVTGISGCNWDMPCAD